MTDETQQSDLSDSAEELEAKAKLLEAKRHLIEARWGFLDRFVMRGMIPLSLVIAAPIATYYFSARADEGVESVKKTEVAVERAESAIKKLDDVTQRLEAMFVVQTVRAHVLVVGARTMRLEIDKLAAMGQVEFRIVRRSVEMQMYEQLRPRVSGPDDLLRQAITGACDEIAADVEGYVRSRGGDVERPPAPRYPEQMQKR